MNRTEKQSFVDEMAGKFRDSELLILADYTGMSVGMMNSLRRKLDADDSIEFRVVKNTLCSLAVDGTEMEPLGQHFVGPTAVLLTRGDPVTAAKLLQEFLKSNAKALRIKAGFYGGRPLSAEDIVALSKLPSREELLGQLLGTLQAPMRQFVSVLAGLPQKLLGTLAAYREELEGKSS